MAKLRWRDYRSQCDKEWAAYLKRIGHTRTSGRCPVCNNIVALNYFQTHIELHKNPASSH